MLDWVFFVCDILFVLFGHFDFVGCLVFVLYMLRVKNIWLSLWFGEFLLFVLHAFVYVCVCVCVHIC